MSMRPRPTILAALLVLVAAAGLPQDPNLKSVATVAELMRAMVIPASNALFNLPREPPEDDAGWDEARTSALILAESGNLLLIGTRTENSEVWKATSRALVDAGEAAANAARDRNAEAIAETGNQIIEACEGCHEQHWIR